MEPEDFSLHDVSISSKDSIAGSEVSRLITEEDLIDSLFFTCDIGQSGVVPVSLLIEYLRCTANSNSEVGLLSSLHKVEFNNNTEN